MVPGMATKYGAFVRNVDMCMKGGGVRRGTAEGTVVGSVVSGGAVQAGWQFHISDETFHAHGLLLEKRGFRSRVFDPTSMQLEELHSLHPLHSLSGHSRQAGLWQ